MKLNALTWKSKNAKPNMGSATLDNGMFWICWIKSVSIHKVYVIMLIIIILIIILIMLIIIIIILITAALIR